MKKTHSIAFFCLLSLFLHLLFTVLLTFLWRGIPWKPKEQVIEVILPDQPYQIADILPPEREERPEKAKFRGLYDSKVPEEIVAPARRSSGAPPAENHQEKAERSPSQKKAERGKMFSAKTPPEKTKESLSGERDFFEQGLPEDYFHDYRIGAHTYLNVFKYPKVVYFVRLKKIFRTTFNPLPPLRASLATNQVSKGQIEVVLGVTVDPAGKLAELTVIRSSGLRLYDQEALRTIRDSAPFAAPPSDLLDSSQMLRMAWTFTVYL